MKTTLHTAVIAVLTLVVSLVFAPAAHALTVINSGHVDIFAISTDTGKPVVNARSSGVGYSELHDLNNARFVIDSSTYRDDYEWLSQLGLTGTKGYASVEADTWFEPGWTAKGGAELEKDGFSSAWIDFTGVTGPGEVALYYTGDWEDEVYPFLSDGSFFIADGKRLVIPGHTHGHWFFTQAGDYVISGKAGAQTLDGDVLYSESFSTTITVVKNENDTIGNDEATEAPVLEENDPTVKPAPEEEPTGPASGNSEVTEPEPTEPTEPEQAEPTEPEQAEPTEPEPTISAEPDDSADTTESGNTGTPASNGTDTSAGHTDMVADTTDKIEFDHGHIDLFNVLAKSGKLVLNAKEDTSGEPIMRDPKDVTLRVKDTALTDVPENLHDRLVKRGYFLSINGDRQAELPFPGWDTSAVNGQFNAVDLEFLNVTGPGRVQLFGTGMLGGVSPLLGENVYDLESGSVIHQAFPAHVHANWLFEKPGVYTMTVRASATQPDSSSKVYSNTATYTWLVGTDTKMPVASSVATSEDNSAANGINESKASKKTSASKMTSIAEALGIDGSSSSDVSAPANNATARSAVVRCRPVQVHKEGGLALHPRVKDDRSVPAKWVDPATMQFAIGAAGKTTAPAAIGAIASGSPVWMISSTQVSGVPWLGVNTQSPSVIDKTQGATTVSLTSFSGPGKMEVFTSGSLGSVIGTKWFSGSGTSGSGSAVIPFNTHVHPNWVFSKPGTYKAGLTMQTQLKDGDKVTGSTVLTFNVGGGSGVDNGHFDLGAVVEKGGTTTVWKTESGEECTPTAAELAVTGANGIGTVSGVAVVLLAIGGLMLGARRFEMQSAKR